MTHSDVKLFCCGSCGKFFKRKGCVVLLVWDLLDSLACNVSVLDWQYSEMIEMILCTWQYIVYSLQSLLPWHVTYTVECRQRCFRSVYVSRFKVFLKFRNVWKEIVARDYYLFTLWYIEVAEFQTQLWSLCVVVIETCMNMTCFRIWVLKFFEKQLWSDKDDVNCWLLLLSIGWQVET